MISDMKDQGGCGSCWTFAATAALEGETYFKTGAKGVSLSEQEYMECSTRRDGCQGGWMESHTRPGVAYPGLIRLWRLWCACAQRQRHC